VTSVSPAAIPLAGNTIVTVNGTFFHRCDLRDGGRQQCAGQQLYRQFRHFDLLSRAGRQYERIGGCHRDHPFGTSEVGAADQILYEDGPIITGVSPLGAAEDGSTLVTVSGANFTDASMVIIGEQNLPSARLPSTAVRRSRSTHRSSPKGAWWT